MCCDRGSHTRVSRNKQLGKSCELFHSFVTRKYILKFNHASVSIFLF